MTLTKGNGYYLSVKNTSPKINWSSTDPLLINVNLNGFITAKGVVTSQIIAKVKNESYICTVKVVDALSYTDFNYSSADGDGYTNYIDLTIKKGSTWNRYFYSANSDAAIENRGISIGNSYNDVIAKFGYTDKTDVTSYSNKLNNEYMPKAYLDYKYLGYNKSYYKRFYFDSNDKLILIIWHDSSLSDVFKFDLHKQHNLDQ